MIRQFILFALFVSTACATSRTADSPGNAQASPSDPPPPAVLLGEAELTCNIDAKTNGVQKLVLKQGSGLAFDAVVSPIVNGTATAKGPDQGGDYAFTSHLAKPAKATLSGVGDVTLDELETKVSVKLAKYEQPGGPGKPFTFTSANMVKGGAYVEFAGKLTAANGDRFAFRINLGETKTGGGRVEPASADVATRPMAKMVVLEAPITTVVQSVTTTVSRIQ